MNFEEWNKDQLKEYLKEKGAKVNGNKAELIARARRYASPNEEIHTPPLPDEYESQIYDDEDLKEQNQASMGRKSPVYYDDYEPAPRTSVPEQAVPPYFNSLPPPSLTTPASSYDQYVNNAYTNSFLGATAGLGAAPNYFVQPNSFAGYVDPMASQMAGVALMQNAMSYYGQQQSNPYEQAAGGLTATTYPTYMHTMPYSGNPYHYYGHNPDAYD